MRSVAIRLTAFVLTAFGTVVIATAGVLAVLPIALAQWLISFDKPQEPLP